MGRIKKAASQKHVATVSPFFTNFITNATSLPAPELPSYLRTFPKLWPFPRGDLYHWIPLLDRFDEILACIVEKYSLNAGPQTQPFGNVTLAHFYTVGGHPAEGIEAKLEALGYGPDGDRELVESIIEFSRLLLEKCGNRSLYSSSEILGDLLNTTSLPLLQSTLRLTLCLAQRYHSRQRGVQQQALLATHFNIDLEKLQKIAAPFPRPFVAANSPLATPSAKGKENAIQTKVNANELTSLVRDNDGWEEWGNVRLLYYPPGTSEQAKTASESGPGDSGPHTLHAPATPTPLRRSATHPTPRFSRGSNLDDSPAGASTTPSKGAEETSRSGKILDLPYAKISSSNTEDILSTNLPLLSLESKYELLQKIRVAQALSGSPADREQILSIRILALTNLAYVHPESTFQQKILQSDLEQSKRLQLTFQLAELVHLGASGDLNVSRTLQTLAIQALDALAKHKARAQDVCAALSVNVNHGVLMFLTRKLVNELAAEDDDTDSPFYDEWRDALLALLRTLPSSSSRTPDTLVAAGLIPMFVDILHLRTIKARRFYARIIEFLDTFVHAVRDALNNLTTAKGFDAISDLIAYETKTAFDHVASGGGFPHEYRNPSIDYQIPYLQQQTLRWLFRFVNHTMQHNGGGFDRVLRNFIDSPQILTSLRLVFENARVFGSHVWSNGVNILSSFIHNEPTSYAVIAEAGLSRSLLAAVMGRELNVEEKPPAVEPEDIDEEHEASGSTPAEPASASLPETKKSGHEYVMARPSGTPLAAGIVPAADALGCIPTAFGAICLNSSGLDLFQSSDALESFFEIFENPEHVKCLKDDPNLVRSLGTTFDELVRHHPALKTTIMSAVIVLAARVGLLAKAKAWQMGLGSKLWIGDSESGLRLSGDQASLFREIGAPKGGSENVFPNNYLLNGHYLPNGGKLVEGDLSSIFPPNHKIDPMDKDEHGLTVADYLFPTIRFLGAFFENQPNCTAFILDGGAEFILDFATLQGLPFNFHSSDPNQELTVLVHMLAETKPHLIIPSLVKRAQLAVDSLAPFWESPSDEGFFTALTSPNNSEGPETEASAHGTFYAKHLNAVLITTGLLREIFALPLYQVRSSQSSAFSQVNLADLYSSLVTSLGSLHAACVWESIVNEKSNPELWAQTAAKPTPQTLGNPSAPGNTSEDSASTAQPGSEEAENAEKKAEKKKVDESSAAFKNVQTLRYLLSALPPSITGFFHNLGLGLLGKKRGDRNDPTNRSVNMKQNCAKVADSIVDSVLRALHLRAATSCESPRHRFAYLIVILSSFSQLLYEVSGDRPQTNYLTYVMWAFKRKGGLTVLKEICQAFMLEIQTIKSARGHSNEISNELVSAYGSIKIILVIFTELASGKSIIESSQTHAMSSQLERNRNQADYFTPGQFLVDLRMEILPMAQEMWNSEFATRSESSIIKFLVDILRSSLDGEYETGAAHDTDTPIVAAEVPFRPFVINKEKETALAAKISAEPESELVKEALYRCNNVLNSAEEYCHAQECLRAPPLIPPESADIEVAPVRETPEDPADDTAVEGSGPNFLGRSALTMLMNQATESGSERTAPEPLTRDDLARVLGRVLPQITSTDIEEQLNPFSIGSQSAPPPPPPQEPTTDAQDTTVRRREYVTIEDLELERENVRSNLIERCLDVLNEHHDVSFELADLISSAIKKHREPESFRRDIGETLVQSLVSLQMENFQTAGKKIAAYAHILALVLQDRDMYNATIEELKDCFSTFLGFIRITPEKSADESFPWVGHVLLIMEKLLSDDCQPPEISWTPPNAEDPNTGVETPAQLKEPLVPLDEKTQLFEALVDILPRVGKDESLALSVCRILVILTRQRTIAARFGEKRNLQRLFVMIKQLPSSITNGKLQSTFMLILRHIVEDEDTIRQIMRSEIVANFEAKTSRQIDTTNYVRQLYHLVLRAPDIFVEVTNEKLRLVRYDSHQRPQTLALKADKNRNQRLGKDDAPKIPGDVPGEASTAADNEKDKSQVKAAEMKPPVVENPDGVIHYLLSELLSYKDVDDKEPSAEPSEKPPSGDQAEVQPDIEMGTDEPPASSSGTETPYAYAPPVAKKSDKPAFKAEDHSIYVYRCFLLQCLTELLSSYNRTKVEFINFSRKADPLATTPSKPRSGILNYLLNVLVPIGTMEHDESLSFKKRSITSTWTMQVLVALCSKTGEYGGVGKRRSEHKRNEEDEQELAFVRRFVLEHALRCYKDAIASTDALDVKYSKLMCLADLFDKMLSGHSFHQDAGFPSSVRQLSKTMFEKHFIPALTASVADIDLNFPSSKRVIKYILRPLNKLTQTAVHLSDTSDISNLGDADEDDEISSATSVSDMDDDREETPDLFRHSTLGMLEPRHDEEETSTDESEGEDDEMYDDEYDEDMDYDEDVVEDDGEVVSDEEIDGVPIEGLSGDAVEVIIDEDDDDDDDDDEDDDDEDDDDDDHHDHSDDEIFAGEITGDHDNDSLEGDVEDEWESEEMTEDEAEADMMSQLEDEMAIMHESHRQQDGGHTNFNDLFRVLNQAAGVEHDGLGVGPSGGLGANIISDELLNELNEEGDEDEMDELDEDVDDYDDYDMDHGSDGDMDEDEIEPWGWLEEETPAPRARTRFGAPPAWATVTEIMPGTASGIMPTMQYPRIHRNQLPNRGNDDGTNPLLIRNDRSFATGRADQAESRPRAREGWLLPDANSLAAMDSPMSFMNAIMQAIGGHATPGFGVVTRPDGIHVHVDRRAILPNRLQDMFNGISRAQFPNSRHREDPQNAVKFSLSTTIWRWQEEARLLYSSTYVEKTQRIVNALLKIMVPPAIEEDKLRQKMVEEERKRLREEQEEKDRLERIAREEEERERKLQQEEENARLQAEREQQISDQPATGAEPMEDVQQTEPTTEAVIQEPTASTAQPVLTTIRGRQVDITSLEIDPEYLEALPDALREEVIMQQLAEQRSQAAAAGEETTEINQEFLEALPEEIREELLQQEAADRRRRERDTARRQANASGTAPRAEDMDAASFLATLDPSLRQAVLADQPEDLLASLGPEYLTEARSLGGRRLAQLNEMVTGIEGSRPRIDIGEQESKKSPRRQVVQMLDKAGIATLLRLMFMPLQGTARHQLNDILHNVCENRQNRSEVISLLLSVLQDGSVDSSAIDRSFSHLSLRARAAGAQKTPQSVKRNLNLTSSSISSDVTPTMVVQQCLGTLSFLSQYNPHVAWFFLTEHDSSATLKLKSLRKGKGKELRANKFALNSLLSLLDRQLIMESPSCMEQLSSLLSSITQPLNLLLRRDKDKVVEDKETKPEDEPAQEDATMSDAPLPTVEAEEQGAEPTAEGEEQEEDNKKPEATDDPTVEEDKRKRKFIEPPVVPDHNFQLVVHILAARECGNKTFRDTVSTINNLSAIPGARDVIGTELVNQAQKLSDTILADVEELLPHIHQSKTGTDMQGLALAKFSPASSDQAKLLRILTALDYLFDPTRIDKSKGTEPESVPKEDVLKRLYESATFGPLWTKLSDCLTVIRQKDNMLNVATILLPLIEALMVVCKNTALKDQPLSRNSRELSSNSTTTESGVSMENIFFKFTEEHRKILNELVRQNPRLMSGTFSLLVKNPKVLEFDNKRNYFTRQVHSRGAEPRHPHPTLQLSVRREQVFLDSFKSLYFKSADELKYGKLNVRFHGEEGVDAGGVTREWFQVLARGMFNPNYALFIPVAADRTTFHPNRLSGVNNEHLLFFKFIGRIIGKAMYEGRVLDCHFSRAVYKSIIGRPVSMKDMETLDLDYYKSLLWMLENDITDIITETFSIETDDFGEHQIIDLVPDGRNIPVTQENKESYIQRVIEYRLVESVREQLDHFLKGFHEIISPELISIFNEQELELLISGLPEIDVDEWKANTEYHNYSASSPQIQWFWRAVRSFDKEERAKLLQFVTGTSKVPLNGFKELEGMNGVSKFNIHRDYGNKDRLPSSHTCFNQLDIPEYDSYEDLRHRLYTAMTTGSGYFGFA